MDEVLSSALRSVVFARLDYLDRLAHDGDEPSRAALADTEITRLTGAWRSLLTAHQPDERGRCPQCSGRRRHRRHPCTVWTIAHQHLIAAAGPPEHRTSRHAAGAGRSTVATLEAS
ncbi:hypothetical protein [Amycolatopsis sp. NPDC051128]|uniref:hypothetical protein n=1 Tax=Amycolatopsis sp. NPDC051128 TaxID=3155412 RepID=UPI0034282515